ncbi:MAG: FAD-dependent oxidoreductase [Planctomycetota bacterium]
MSEADRLDVVVIGAGPAGAGAALRLAQRGVSVLLVDRQRLPRAKVCGGCLHRRGAARLAQWGVADDILRACGAERLVRSELVAGGRTLVWPRGHGWSVDRAAFDLALANAAAQRGATLEDRTAARVLRADRRGSTSGWSVRLRHADGQERTVHPTWVFVADGLGGSALSGLKAEDAGTFAVTHRRGSYVGTGALLGDDMPGFESFDLPAGDVRMFVGRGGYVGAVRTNAVPGQAGPSRGIEFAAAMRPGLLKDCGGIGAAVSRLMTEAQDNRDVAETIGRANWRMTPPLTAFRKHVAAPGLLIVGDAAGYVEPFTGEGMAWALQSADDASDVVAEALDGTLSYDAAAARWTKRDARQRRLGRMWCWGTRATLRQPALIQALTTTGQALQKRTWRSAVSNASAANETSTQARKFAEATP